MKDLRKALVVTTVASTIDQFCMNDISILFKDYKVQVAANFTIGNNTSPERLKEFKEELTNSNIIINEIEFDRNPLSNHNVKAYRKLKILFEKNQFDLIHCHTPIAAMLTRLAVCKDRETGTKVIYTAHGFHFYKGAPIKNWLIYYPIEKWLSKYTDILITINKEDYQRAKKSFKARRVEYIPGVGIDIAKFSDVVIDKAVKRKGLGIPKDAFVVLSVGELSKNKNHGTIIKAVAKLNNPDIYYVICGQGQLKDYLKELANKLGIGERVKLLGFRTDVAEIYKAADIFAFPSYREGLPVSLMEAMASGLPVICSNIRGNIDLIDDGKGGYLLDPINENGFSHYINIILKDQQLCKMMGAENASTIKQFDNKSIISRMNSIYDREGNT